jgi:hypothetical protein
MMKLVLPAAVLVVSLLATGQHLSTANAEPGDLCQTSRDCDDGERCKISTDGEKGTCVLRRRQTPGPGPDPDNMSHEDNRPMYCLDVYNIRRCQVGGPSQEGAACYCNGIPGIGRQSH